MPMVPVCMDAVKQAPASRQTGLFLRRPFHAHVFVLTLLCCSVVVTMSFPGRIAMRPASRFSKLLRREGWISTHSPFTSTSSGTSSSSSTRLSYYSLSPKSKLPDRYATRRSGFRFFAASNDIKSEKDLLDQEIDDDQTSLVDEEQLTDTTILDEEDLSTLPKGSNKGWFVVKQYKTNGKPFDFTYLASVLEPSHFERLELSPNNVSLPAALMMMDPEEYPSVSRARKACRKGNVLIHNGPLGIDESGVESFRHEKCITGRVGDRIVPGDVIGKQVRMGDGYFPVVSHNKPPFDLPVVYEDDYFAIVHKPAGIVVYANRGGGHGIMTVRAGLPFAVTPPQVGTYATLRRPQPVHRLDKPTSGLLLVAKTKPAMVHLSLQFRDRKVKKTYVAVVNGIPPEPKETAISSIGAHELGVDVDPNSSDKWQLIDHALDEKSAVTIWRALRYAKSLKANDNYLTLVELKPKTGRYHQLRRHMAWVCERPLVGDSAYDGGGDAMQLRERGLFLCSNGVTLEHPFYNSEMGRKLFDEMSEEQRLAGGKLWLSEDDTIMVSAAIETPEKFGSLLDREEERFLKLSDQDP